MQAGRKGRAQRKPLFLLKIIDLFMSFGMIFWDVI